jgi:hypothetical protein
MPRSSLTLASTNAGAFNGMKRSARGPGADKGTPTMTRLDLSSRMAAMTGWRRPASLVVGAIVVVALAIPVFAADPSADPSASAGASIEASQSASPQPTPEPTVAATPKAAATPQATPKAHPSAKPGKPDQAGEGKGNKRDKTPEVAITLHGTVVATTNTDGDPGFSLTSGGTTYELEVGPPWFWGANNPLAKFAGKTVTVTGETHTGSTDVDVLTVDGTVIREPGKPPWAGGWKVVGSAHPGWSQEKADRFKAKFGDCFPPGLCKKDAPTSSPAIPRGD